MRQRGFTLLELMVTVTVGGIIIAVAVPNLRSYREAQRVSRASDTIAVACMEARAKARAENHSIIVDYRRDTSQVAIVDDEDNDGVIDGDETESVRSLGEGLSLANTTFTNDQLIFDSRGSAVSGGSVFVTGAEGMSPKRIRISAGTGRVTIESVESTNE